MTSENPTQPGRSHLAGLTGLRGMAALLVFIYHIPWNNRDRSPEHMYDIFVNPLGGWDVGVCIFFILSGFLLSRTFWNSILDPKKPRVDLQRYFIRRAMRILPAYYLVLISLYVFHPTIYTLKGGMGFLTHAFCVQTFFDDFYLSSNSVLWTIAIEAQFYVLLPLLMLAVKKGFRSGGAFGACIALLASVVALEFAYLAIAPKLFFSLNGGMVNWSLSGPAINRSVFYFLKWFGVGILCAGIHQSNWFRTKAEESCRSDKAVARLWPDLFYSVSLIGLAIIMTVSEDAQWREIALWGWPLNAIVCATLVISTPYSRVGAFLFHNRAIIFIGEISYGIYLWHYPIQVAVGLGSLVNIFDGAMLTAVSGLLALFLSVCISTLSYTLLERPALRVGHQAKSFRELFRAIRGKLKVLDDAIPSSTSPASQQGESSE